MEVLNLKIKIEKFLLKNKINHVYTTSFVPYSDAGAIAKFTLNYLYVNGVGRGFNPTNITSFRPNILGSELTKVRKFLVNTNVENEHSYILARAELVNESSGNISIVLFK